MFKKVAAEELNVCLKLELLNLLPFSTSRFASGQTFKLLLTNQILFGNKQKYPPEPIYQQIRCCVFLCFTVAIVKPFSLRKFLHKSFFYTL